jgi:hypothetical protein
MEIMYCVETGQVINVFEDGTSAGPILLGPVEIKPGVNWALLFKVGAVDPEFKRLVKDVSNAAVVFQDKSKPDIAKTTLVTGSEKDSILSIGK